MAQVVGALCGIQAQVMPAAEMGLAIRLEGVTRRHVQAALWDQRTLVKTIGLRGTIHLFPADELSLWMAALGVRSARHAKHLAQQDMDWAQIDRLVDAIGAALDGRQLTTRELGEAVGRIAGAWAAETVGSAWVKGWPRWRLALGDAARAGRLLYGPPRGAEVTFVRPDQWLGGWRAVDASAAQVEVFRRYVRAYGPATARDCAQWFGMEARDGRELAAQLRDELVEVDVQGYRALLLAADTRAALPEDPASVRLLPHFDTYAIGCHPRAALLAPGWADRVPPRTTPSQFPLLLVDGTVAGLWERQGQGKRFTVRVEPLVALGADQQQELEAQARRIGTVLEGQAALEIGPVAARPHL
jgi:hypothetical protein